MIARAGRQSIYGLQLVLLQLAAVLPQQVGRSLATSLRRLGDMENPLGPVPPPRVEYFMEHKPQQRSRPPPPQAMRELAPRPLVATRPPPTMGATIPRHHLHAAPSAGIRPGM
jgi:hypothetical protein